LPVNADFPDASRAPINTARGCDGNSDEARWALVAN